MKSHSTKKWFFPRLCTSVLLGTAAFAEIEAPKPYLINPGDTLSQIAEGLYGNWIKYKDLWELNKDRIQNPNLIFPGQRLRLIGGGELELVQDESLIPTGSSVDFERGPLLASNKTLYGNNKGTVHRPSQRYRSQEWQVLPKQRWETFTFRVPPEIDPQGFDRRSRVGIRYKDQILIPAQMTADRVAVLGQITGGRTEYSRFGIGEQVLIRPDEELQVGKTYSISEEPAQLTSGRDGRVGFLYRFSGKIKVVGVRDGVFVGTIVQASRPIERGMILVQDVESVRLTRPIAAPSPLLTHILESENELSANYADFRIVFLDVGTQDGVKPGMVFRRYQHTDPYTGKDFSSQDFLVDAELQVLSSSESFSSALVLNARAPIRREDELVAITDVSDLGRHVGLQSSVQDKPATGVDDLDSLDATQGLGEKEDLELQQLEEESSGADEEIQKVEVNSGGKKIIGLGDERGPNDRTGPTGSAAPAPEAPQSDDVLDDTLEDAPPSSGLEEPIEGGILPEEPGEVAPESTPETTAPEALPPTAPEPGPEEIEAEPSSETPPSDPFSTESFQDDAPVTEDNPEPPSDPLLEAIPDSSTVETPSF